MGLTTRVKLFGEAVTTDKIAADAVIAVDIDETTPYNFTNQTSTWTGERFTGTLCKITQIGVTTIGASNQFSGSIEFGAAWTSTVVANTIITDSAQIFYGYDDDPVTRFYTSARSASTSFTITASSAPAAGVTINYLIVQ